MGGYVDAWMDEGQEDATDDSGRAKLLFALA